MPGNDEIQAPADRVLEDLDAAALAYAERVPGLPAGAAARSRAEFAGRCLPFAGRLARRYRGRGEPLEDLEQVARLGLLKAIDGYDPERGSFTAYAVITISGEIKRHFRDKTWGVHVPRRVQDLSLEVGHAATALTSSLSRSPTVTELAGHLRVAENLVTDALGSSAGYSPASLNAPVTGTDGASELGDLLGGADADLESVDDRITVSGLLRKLPARERRILAMRFYGNRTQSEIAADLGISQMHVSRLLSRALSWLREAMLSDAPPRWEGAHPVTGHRGMQVAVLPADGALTVRIRGEIDRDTAERLRTSLRHAVRTAGPDPVVIDLAGVPLIDAAGIAVLLDAAAGDVALSLVGAQPYVSRILAVSGLGGLIRGAGRVSRG
jgi:RNA polymerase sigma-B factor